MNFTIKYEGLNVDNGMDIKDFGESLIGFSELSKEIFKIGKIKTEVDVKITSVRKGSIIVDIALGISDYIHSFSSFEDFLYFIEITNTELFNEITDKLQEIGNEGIEKWKDLESFNKDYPTIGSIISNGIYDLIKTYIIICIFFKIKDKKVENIGNKEDIDIGIGKILKGETLKAIKKVVNKGKSSHFLEPIIEDKVSDIKIGKEGNYIEINNDNFEYFIGQGNEILPELENGKKYAFTGSFTAMQSNRGETISFSSHVYKNNNGQPFNFSCYLSDGKTTEDYADFYGNSKDLKIIAEVIRVSNYKKPKLKIIEVELHQQVLDI